LALRGDVADDLVAWHERQFGLRQLAIHDVQVGAAHGAGADLDKDFAGAGLWGWQLSGAQGLPLGAKDHRFHRGIEGRKCQIANGKWQM
jgi:hypothetical protein